MAGAVFWDAVSLSIIPVIFAPIVLYIQTKNLKYAPIIVGTFMSEIFISFSRQVPVLHPVMIRPAGAKNCNIFNGGGSYDGQIGMPSGHMMLTTFITVSFLFMFSRTKNIGRIMSEKPQTGLAAGVYVVLMAISRVARGCHNIPQVIVGGLLGYALAFVLY